MIQKVKISLRAPLSLAYRSNESGGSAEYRTEFMRDRDRILYSKAFRRLSGKTQVYFTGSDDHLRTRLTHTLEVSQIARTIAQKLKLDCDLTEAIALGHDIGHTPFGHAGERMLHQLMTENFNTSTGETITIPYTHRGFKHNLQGVATSIVAEKNYDNDGLALTNFTLWGIQAHSENYYKNESPEMLGYYKRFEKYYKLKNCDLPAISLEAYVFKEADEIAQRHHDLEDAIRGGLVTNDEIIKEIRTDFKKFLSASDFKILNKMGGVKEEQEFLAYLAKLIVNLYVTKLLESSIANINWLIQNYIHTEKQLSFFLTNSELRKSVPFETIISYRGVKAGKGDSFCEAADKFKKFISGRVLASYDIQKNDAKGQYIIRKLFRAFVTSPAQLPDHCVKEFIKEAKANDAKQENKEKSIYSKGTGMGALRIEFLEKVKSPRNITEELILRRVVCNYIAGMTDNYAKHVFADIYK